GTSPPAPSSSNPSRRTAIISRPTVSTWSISGSTTLTRYSSHSALRARRSLQRTNGTTPQSAALRACTTLRAIRSNYGSPRRDNISVRRSRGRTPGKSAPLAAPAPHHAVEDFDLAARLAPQFGEERVARCRTLVLFKR